MNIISITVSASPHPRLCQNELEIRSVTLTATVTAGEDLFAARDALFEQLADLTEGRRRLDLVSEIQDTRLAIIDRQRQRRVLQEELRILNSEPTGDAEPPADDPQPITDFDEGSHQGN